MYSLNEHQIDFILDDIKKNGIGIEDLQLNLLDHICCIIENNLEENGDFEQFYFKTIRTFYKKELVEIEEETKALLIFKNYYKMKKVMLVSGIWASLVLSSGIVFKFLYWPGASVQIILGIFTLSFIYLPLLFILKIKEKKAKNDKVLIGFASIVTISMCIAILFKMQHWPGANMLALISIGVLLLLFLPVYFFTGIRNPETKLNTIVTSTLIVSGIGLFLTLARSPYGTRIQNLRSTGTFVRNDQIYRTEEKFVDSLSIVNRNENQISQLGISIRSLCEELKSYVLESEIGAPEIDIDFESKNMIIGDNLSENYFLHNLEAHQKLMNLKKMIEQYNVLALQKIPVELTVLDEREDKVIKALNDFVQIQMYVLQNARMIQTN